MSDSLAESLQSVLSNPAAMDQIRSLMGNMTLPSDREADALLPSSSASPSLAGLSGGDADPLLSGMMKLGEMYSRANTKGDPRMNLLSAIRPYLNPKRTEGVDSAMRILRITQLLKIAKEENLLGQLL